MMEVGRLCLKIAGRDAGQKCVVVEVLDNGFVTIDGATRRRKCNIAHLEPLKETITLKVGASHADVAAAFEKIGVKARSTKPKKAAERVKQVRAFERKAAVAAEARPKKAEKKAAPKAEEKPAEKAEAPVEEKKE